jgi:hypothetical protein
MNIGAQGREADSHAGTRASDLVRAYCAPLRGKSNFPHLPDRPDPSHEEALIKVTEWGLNGLGRSARWSSSLCCGVAMILGVHFPAHGAHDAPDVGKNSSAVSISEFKMLGLAERIDIIDCSPSKDGPLAVPDRRRAGGSSNSNIALERETRVRHHYPFSGRSFCRLKTQRRLMLDLKFCGDTVCDPTRGCLPGVGYFDFDDECGASVGRNDFGRRDPKICSQLVFGGSFSQFDRCSSGGRGIPRCVGGSLGLVNGGLHVVSLLIGGSAQRCCLTKEAGRLPCEDAREDREQNVRKVEFNEASNPIRRSINRTGLSFVSLGLCLLGMRLVERSADNGWRRLGTFLCFFGPLALIVGWGIA